MKKLLCILLALCMSALMFACAAPAAAPAEEPAPAPEAAPAEEPAAEESLINFDEEPYEVSIQFVGLFEENRDVEAVEAALNEITLKKINCTVDIVPIFIGDLASTTALNIAGGEKMDIITVGLTNAMNTAAADGLLLPLEDLLAERGPAAAAATANVMEAQTIDGHVYALTGYPYAAWGTAFAYNKTMADEYGIDMHDYMTYEDFEAAGEILKEHGVYLTTFGASAELNYKFFHLVEAYGSNGGYGAILDPANSTTIENVFATQAFKDYCYAVKRWADNGYLPADQLTDTTRTQEYFAQQKIFGTSTSYTPSQITVWLNDGFETGMAQLTPGVISTSSAGEFMLAIAANCERPDKAMDLLNLIYGDRDVANLLQYGVEGLDYARVEGTENVITYDGTPNADHNGYFAPFVHFGDPTMTWIVAPLTDGYYDDLRAFNEASKKTPSFGYSFNASDFTAEAGAISNVLAEYLPLLNSGLAPDVDAQLAAFLAALDAAGINDVIAANQASLDAYLAK